jgi:Uncharacterized protein conserved in bacteria (DUF2188)
VLAGYQRHMVEELTRTPNRKHYFIEQTDDGRYAIRGKGSQRATEILDTQRDASERAKDLNPNDHRDVERVRDINIGGRDKWRSAK